MSAVLSSIFQITVPGYTIDWDTGFIVSELGEKKELSFSEAFREGIITISDFVVKNIEEYINDVLPPDPPKLVGAVLGFASVNENGDAVLNYRTFGTIGACSTLASGIALTLLEGHTSDDRIPAGVSVH